MEVKTESGTLVSSVAEEVADTNSGKAKKVKVQSGAKYAGGGVFPGEKYKTADGNIHEDN